MGRQTFKASLDRYVVHNREWYMGGVTLGPAGRRHVLGLLDELRRSEAALILAPDEDVRRDEPRRRALVELLANAGFSDALARVRLAYPIAEGLYGEEAIRIYPRLFQQTNGGFGGGGGGGGAGGFGGGGGGGALFGGGGGGGFR